MADKSTISPYQLMGGEPAVLKLVDKFYFFMDTLDEAAAVRKLHSSSLLTAKDKLYKFLSGWLGGPDLFIQEFGHPMLRRRHFSFAVGQVERDQWMFCMNKAMQELTMDSILRESLLNSLDQLATHMINQ